ncbi:MAG: hypothetical protein ACKOBG_04350 [Actinomycetota bacterium]
MSDVPPPPPPPPPGASPAPSGADAGSALSYGFKKFQASAGVLIIAMIIPIVASIAVSLGGAIFKGSIGGAIVQILAWVASTMGAIGVWRVALMITAGETPDLGRAYQYDRWGEWLAFSFVFGVIVAVGFFLCIIPGLLAMAFLGLAPLYFIDGRRSVGEALTASREAASARRLALPVFLVTIVGPLGILLCFVGVFVTMPVSYVGLAFLYRNAIGQSVAQ